MVDTQRAATTLPAGAQDWIRPRRPLHGGVFRHVRHDRQDFLDVRRSAAFLNLLHWNCGLGVRLWGHGNPDLRATPRSHASLVGAQRQPRRQGVVRAGYRDPSNDLRRRGLLLFAARSNRTKSDLVHGLLFRTSRHRRRMCLSRPGVFVSRHQECNRLWCGSELRHVEQSLLVVGRSPMGKRSRGSAISGAPVARRQLLVDRAQLVRTTTLPMEDAKGVPGRAGCFRERGSRLEPWRPPRSLTRHSHSAGLPSESSVCAEQGECLRTRDGQAASHPRRGPPPWPPDPDEMRIGL